jgi:6-phosphogluconate dehydrogenase
MAQLGMVGLGRMGAGIVRRLLRDGHDCVVYDVSADLVAELEHERATGAATVEEFVQNLDRPRAAWLMIPAAITGRVVDDLSKLIEPDDVIIDGGNSYYRDDIARAEMLKPKGIHYVDCGTSGGVFGLQRGFCLMIGGEREPVRRLDPIFKSIAPGEQAAPPTPGRNATGSTAQPGYLHCGATGAGHFVKMVYNGIEYGIMAAYAEGLNVLHRANIGKQDVQASAEIAPLSEPRYYRYDIDTAEVAELWRRGSVITSWLLDLIATALAVDPSLGHLSGRVSDSGEGRWTIHAAIDEGVPVPVLAAALYERFSSRGESRYADQLRSAMRQQFGGHLELEEPEAAGTVR